MFTRGWSRCLWLRKVRRRLLLLRATSMFYSLSTCILSLLRYKAEGRQTLHFTFNYARNTCPRSCAGRALIRATPIFTNQREFPGLRSVRLFTRGWSRCLWLRKVRRRLLLLRASSMLYSLSTCILSLLSAEVQSRRTTNASFYFQLCAKHVSALMRRQSTT